MFKKIYFLCTISVFLFTIPLSAEQPTIHEIPKQPHPKEVWINVFIHGIISIKSHITVSNFLRFLTDNLEDSAYYHTVLLMREDPFFYQNQAIQSFGLKPIEMQQKAGAAASLMAQLFEYINKRIYSDNPPIPTSSYYTFGWSGLLSRNARYDDAKRLYMALQEEVAKLRTLGIEPKVRLIGYSHGGKIIMNLAAVKQKEKVDQSLHIDEVLFIGMPIQCDDIYLIENDLFKKVFNIFSRGDRVQKLDFFSCGQFFSNRRFNDRKDIKVPNKIAQVEIKVIRKKGELCSLFAMPPCDELLYDGMKRSRQFRNVSPGHTELWFFGWTPLHYRETFPLYPFPIIAFAPYILHLINGVKEDFCPMHAIKIIIDPRCSTILLANRYCTRDMYRAPFLSHKELSHLREIAQAYQPINFTLETYNEHIKKAYDQGEYLATHKHYCNK